MPYSDAQIRQYIREVVRATKDTAKVDTGYLKRSIKGTLVGRNNSVEFREIFYGAYNGNSKLIENAQRIMPDDIPWKVIFVDEEGNEKEIEGKTRTGRTIRREKITSENVSTSKIKELMRLIKTNRAKKNITTEGDREDDSE